MSDETRPADADDLSADDLSADTERFRRFARRDDGEGEVASGGGSGVSFRLLTLVGGLALVVLVIWLLLR